jgi:DNA-binding response OmpR family regulator
VVALQRIPTRSHGRRSLLIADHEEGLRRGLDSLFRTEGYETHLAADDAEVVEIVHREWIDVVILEFELPRSGGLDVLRVIRSVVRGTVPCVLTAAEVSGRVQLDALNEDVFTVVPKPVDDELIRDIVRSVMRRDSPL